MPTFADLDQASADPTCTFRSVTQSLTPATMEGGSGLDTHPLEGGSGVPLGDGAFSFRERLGRGGMGEVWSALQVSLGRIVAVKIPVSHGESETSADRSRRLTAFRQEALVAAQLEHPNIVPVHEQGVDGGGRPLLAMKMVQGRPWHDILRDDGKVMTAEDLLQKHLPILVDMTQAVAFAHSKGIIHRDLKPSQVMVGEFGEVMLMDWGLAIYLGETRALEESVRPEFPTRHSSSNPSGTPAMMAPEQTRSDPSGLSERTDVYLLGGTLYFLLTGTYPHGTGSAREAFAMASEGIVEDPRERTPGRDMPDELVALCNASLSADQGRRPATAAAFLGALRDYLSGASRRREAVVIANRVEAVIASGTTDYEELTKAQSDLARAQTLWPGSSRLRSVENQVLAAYAGAALERDDLNLAELHARRIMDGEASRRLLGGVEKRHSVRRQQAMQRRMAGMAVVALLIVIAVGALLFSVKVREERNAADRARVAAIKERNEANSAKVAAVKERDEAQRQRLRAEEAESVSEGRRVTVEAKSAALKTSRSNAEGLATFMLGDLRTRLAELKRLDLLDGVAKRTGEYYRTVPFDELDTHEKLTTLEGIRALCSLFIDQSNVPEAARMAAFGSELTDKLRKSAPSDGQADFAAMQMTSMQCRIASLEGNLEQAMGFAASALEIGQSLLRSNPEDMDVQRLMGTLMGEVGQLNRQLGKITEARDAMKEGITILEGILEASPDDVATARELGSVYNTLAGLYIDQREVQEGIDILQKARAIMHSLLATDPGNEKWQADYASTLRSLSLMSQRAGDMKTAEETLTESVEITERLRHDHPLESRYAEDLIGQLFIAGQFHLAKGQPDEAAASFRRGVETADELAAIDPANTDIKHSGVVLRFQLARFNASQYRIEEALGLFLKNCQILEELIALDDSNNFWKKELGANSYQVADLEAMMRNFDASAVAAGKLLEINAFLLTLEPARPEFFDGDQGMRLVQSASQRAQGHRAEALALETKRLEPLDKLIELQPEDDTWRREKSSALLNIGGDYLALGDSAQALAFATKVKELRPAGDAGDTDRWKSILARTLVLEGQATMKAGDVAGGKAKVTQGRNVLLGEVPDGGKLGGVRSYVLLDLIRAAKALGETPDPAWGAELNRRKFYEEPWE